MARIRKFVPVDRGVPIPPKPRPHYKWPWHKMTEVGDSFLRPLDGIDEDVLLQNMRVQARNATVKYHPIVFMAARHNRGIRVWRTK